MMRLKQFDDDVISRFDTVHGCNERTCRRTDRQNRRSIYLALCTATCRKNVQEAQLSQRDRATLCVIEYFAKSLKVTRDHSK